MGFRDLRNFNLAMLGKQGWRLLTKPDSLCAKVLKGRYYHDGDYLTCTRRKHAGHTWRAIFAGRNVLKQGLIKRIGNGESTDIWQDRWIPNHFGGKPLTPADDQEATQVSDLMTGTGQWDEGHINQIFIPVDAVAIMRTPIRPGRDDVWAWEPEKHGCYSVRSAYRILDSARICNEGGASPEASGNTVWKKIWKLEVPPKIRVFWWRVIHEFLPAKQILHRRHVEPLPNCDVCGAPEETIRHVLMECTVARAFWCQFSALAGVKLPILHPETWAHDLAEGRGIMKKDQSSILIGMYSLWMQRNRTRHGHDTPIRVAIHWAIDLAFDLVQVSKPQGESSVAVPEHHWSQPPEGWFKCNTDGAFYERQWSGATGAVVRDHNGMFFRGKAQWYDHCLDPLNMEARACRDGLALALQAGVHKIWLETDCQELLKLWQTEANGRLCISSILEEIRSLSVLFQAFKFTFAPRACNRVAHSLARIVSGETRLGWWSRAPASVLNLLESDCNPATHE